MKKNIGFSCAISVICTMLAGIFGYSKLGGATVAIALIVVSIIASLGTSTLLILYFLKKIRWYESMLDSIPFPISVTDMDMKWTFINNPVEQMLKVKRSDVIGKHCSNWGAGICNTDNCGINCLRQGKHMTTFNQADMDFQVNIAYLYDRGNQIGHIEVVQDITPTTKVQKEQEKLIDDIGRVSGSFLASSSEIANGSQSLAQGASEQAASVEELSAIINDVAKNTVANADMAKKAADLASNIKKYAEKGNDQMDNMMEAVKEISDASHSIKNVIKVIDDIAFQTNILALNAAVEAARAGDAGKGFAVVAEEVRNLAGKSAEAAKDTEALIANSMEKSEMGVNIANDTAASLAEIVSGINESNRIVNEIAASSEEQSVAITQINQGIEQVARVVQQNSATAEQSAAASAEMNRQSSELDAMVMGFHDRTLRHINN